MYVIKLNSGEAVCYSEHLHSIVNMCFYHPKAVGLAEYVTYKSLQRLTGEDIPTEKERLAHLNGYLSKAKVSKVMQNYWLGN